MTLASAWLGFRFYKGYFLTAAAPLALLAAAPWGLGGRGGALPSWARAALGAPVALLIWGQMETVQSTREDRARPHDRGGRIIAEHVVAHSVPDDRIWVWGWHLWDVYPYSGRRSASAVYKSLGLLTPPNDDTWRRPASPPRFVDGVWAERLLTDFERTPPKWVVLGSTVPHREFVALRRHLRTHYRRDRRVRLNRVEFWELRQ
jgi:hypothetical protein